MKEKPLIKYIGRQIFTCEDVKIIQLLKPITEEFERVINQSKQELVKSVQETPSEIIFDLDHKMVSFGDIKARKVDNGFKVGEIEIREDEIRQTIDQQLKESIEKN